MAATAAQIAAAMGIAIFPVIAPQLALMLGVDASYVGYQISLLFGAAMLASTLVGTVVLRWGACRGMQWALWLAAAGMSIALVGKLWTMPKDPAMLNTVKTGDKVKFTAEKTGGAYVITLIESAR